MSTMMMVTSPERALTDCMSMSQILGIASLMLLMKPSCVTIALMSSAVRCSWMNISIRSGILLIIASLVTYSISMSFTRIVSSTTGGIIIQNTPANTRLTAISAQRIATTR